MNDFMMTPVIWTGLGPIHGSTALAVVFMDMNLGRLDQSTRLYIFIAFKLPIEHSNSADKRRQGTQI